MEVWELVARESIRDRIARWNSNGDAGRFTEMVQVLAPDVEFQASSYLDEFRVVDGEWLITKRTVTTEGVDPDGWAAVLA